jgi:hypothetical protein
MRRCRSGYSFGLKDPSHLGKAHIYLLSQKTTQTRFNPYQVGLYEKSCLAVTR